MTSQIAEDDNFVVAGPPPLHPLPDEPLGEFFYKHLHACRDDNTEALVDASSGRSYTYRQLFGQTCALAASFLRQAYKKGTKFAVCSENSLEFAVPVIATFYVGGVLVPINNNYTHHELSYALEISKPRVMFCSMNTIDRIEALRSKLPFLERIVVLDSERSIYKGAESMKFFISRNLNSNRNLYKFFPVQVDTIDDTVLMAFSSGTTGLPKAVMLKHTNILTRLMYAKDHRLLIKKEIDTTLGFLPFFHNYGMCTMLTAIMNHVKMIVLPKFDETLFLSCIEKHKISTLPLVPPIAILLAKSPTVEKYDLSSVQEIVCGAAPLRKEIEEAIRKRLRVKTMRQAYGMTETTLGVVVMPADVQRVGSSGKIAPGMICKIRDPETGRSLGPNQVGEICLKGPCVMKGYYENEEATRNAFINDGWLLTGDLGYYDKEEFFYIIDRLKELIKYKGFQVAPAELEALLVSNPEITDAGVVGVPNEEVGELPLAFVVKHPKSDLTESKVKKFVEDKLSSHKWLRGGVIFVESIPKNASGKILRRELKVLLKNHLKSKL